MKTGKIIISDNGNVAVHLVNSQVWLSKCQLANLFGVYVSTIDVNIRSILKSGVIPVNIRNGGTVSGNTVFPDLYDLEMVTALAFRVSSEKAKFFREWVLKKAITKIANSQPPVFLSIEKKRNQLSN